MWGIAEFSIHLDDEATDLRLVTVQIHTPAGIIHVMGSMSTRGPTVLLSGLHPHGASASDLGFANLRRLAPFIMQEFGYDELIFQGRLERAI